MVVALEWAWAVLLVLSGLYYFPYRVICLGASEYKAQLEDMLGMLNALITEHEPRYEKKAMGQIKKLYNIAAQFLEGPFYWKFFNDIEFYIGEVYDLIEKEAPECLHPSQAVPC